MALNVQTYRMSIIAKLKTMYEAVDNTIDPEPLDPWPFKFSLVKEGPLADVDFKKNYAIGIVPGPERKSPRIYPFMESDWTVVLEWQAYVPQGLGLTPLQHAEKVLGVVQRVFYKNQDLDGTVIDVRELGNEVDLESYGDKTVAGVVTIEIKYRHDADDTRVTA